MLYQVVRKFLKRLRFAGRVVTTAAAIAGVVIAGTPVSVRAAVITWSGAGADANLNTAGNWVGGIAPSALDSLVFAGGTNLTITNNYAANTQFNGLTFNAGAGTFTLNGAAINLGGDVLDSATSTQTLNTNLALLQNTTFTTAAATGNLVNNGVLSGGFSLTKAGAGTLTLSGSAANTYTGATIVNAGTLALNFANLAPVANASTNLINNQSALQLGGGTLSITGNATAGATTSQAFNGTTLNAGASAITLANGGGAGTSINLGAITRNIGSTLVITPGTSTSVTSSSASGAVGSLLTDSGAAFATVGQNDWAVVGAGSSIVAAGTGFYTNTTNTATGLSGNANVVTVVNTLTAGTITTSSIRYNATGRAVTIPAASTLITGGILLGTGVTSNASIAAGSATTSILTSAGTGRDLPIINNSNFTFTVGALIANNGTAALGLTKSGSGLVVISNNNNSFTGPVNINQGTLSATAANALATASSVNIASNATLSVGAAVTVRGLSGSGNISSTGTFALTVTNTASSFSGIISDGTGVLSLVKNTGADLTLTGLNTYTGSTTINNLSITATTLADGGVASSIGQSGSAAGNLVFGSNANAALIYTGTATSTNRLFTITGGATITNSGTGALNFNGNGTLALSGTATRTLTLNGVQGGLLAPTIGDTGTPTLGSGVVNVTKAGTGAWTLSGANFYTGITTVSAGTLGITSLANAGVTASLTTNGTDNTATVTSTAGLAVGQNVAISAFPLGTTITGISGNTLTLSTVSTSAGTANAQIGSGNALGISSNAATNLVLGSASTLQFSGTAAVSTDRLFSVTGNTTLDASGTAGASISFLNPGSLPFSKATTATTFTLTGTNTDGNTLASVIQNSTGTGTPATVVVKSGTGVWNLTGANTYTGATTINAGTLAVNNLAAGASPSSLGQSTSGAANLVLAGGTLTYNGSSAATTDRLLTLNSGTTSTLNSSGAGSVVWSNTGNLAIAGTVAARLNFGGTNTGANSFAPSIRNSTGSGTPATSVVKQDAGTWTLAGVNTYTGGTTINGGTLLVGNTSGSATGTGAVTVNNSGTLGGTGSVAGAVTLNAGAILAPGPNGGTTPGTLTLGSLTIQPSAQLNFRVSDAASDLVTLTGSGTPLTINGGIVNLNTVGTLSPGTITLISYSGTLGGSGSLSLASNLVVSGGNQYRGQINTATAGQVNLVVSTIPTIVWNNGSGNGLWDIGTSANWSSGTYDNATIVSFDGSTPGTITIDNVTVQPLGIQFSNPAGADYTINANGTGSIGGSTSLVKDGAGALTINTANSFTGGVTLVNGTLAAGNNAALGTGAVTVAAGTGTPTLQAAGGPITLANSLTLNNNLTIGGSNALSLSSTVTLAAGPRTITLANSALTTFAGISSTNNGLTLAGSGSATINGALSLGTAGFTQSSTGVVLLNAANSYSGTTTISGGTLRAGTSGAFSPNSSVSLSGGVLDLNNINATLPGFAGTSGSVQLGSGTLTVANAANGQFDGSIAGTGGLTKQGAGTLTLTSAASSYTGPTRINTGTLVVANLANGGSNSSLGASDNSASNLVLNGGTLSFTGSSAGSTDRLFTVSASSTIDASGTTPLALTNTGDLVFNGTAATTLTLTGSNTGANTLNATIANGTAATALAKTGLGAWTLTGANTYTGGTTISGGGTLNLSGASSSILGATTSTVSVNGAGTTLNLGNTNAQTIATLNLGGGSVAGTGTLNVNTSITAAGPGSVLNAPVTLTSGGTVSIAANGQLTLQSTAVSFAGTTGTVNLAAGGQFVLATGAGNSYAITRSFTSATGTIRSASGNNTISGNINSTSLTTIQVDTGSNLALTGDINGAATNGIVVTGSGSGSINNFSGNAGQPLTKNGTGTWTILGTNGRTTAGANINAGILNVQSSAGLGSNASGSTGATVVASGATLQLQTTSAGITIGLTGTPAVRPISLSGTGATGTTGGLQNVSGANSLLGSATIAGNATIAVDAGSLTLGQATSTIAFGASANSLTLTAATGASGTLAGQITGAGALTFTGSGSWSLTNSGNNFSGATTVTGGTLALAGSGALPSTSIVVGSTAAQNSAGFDVSGLSSGFTLAAGQTISGFGTVAVGAGSLAVGSGTLSPGAVGNPGPLAITINNANNLSFAAGSTLNLGGNNDSLASLAITSSTGTLTLGGNLVLNVTGSQTLNSYQLLTVTGGATIAGTFTSLTGLPTGYQIAYRATEVDLVRPTNATIGLTATPAASTIITGGSVTINGTLSNTAAAPANNLNASLTGSAGVTGLPSGTTSVAAGASTPYSGLFTSTTLGVNSGAITAADANATNSPQSANFNVNVLGHAAPSLTVASGNNQTVIVGATGVSASLTLANGTAAQTGLSALDVSTLVGLTGATGSAVIGSGSTGTYTAALSAATVGLNQTTNVSLLAGDQQSLAGASALAQQSQSLTLNVLGHSAPSLSTSSVNYGIVHQGATLTPATTNLNNGSGNVAGLQIVNLGGLTGGSAGQVINAGSGVTLTAEAPSTSTAGGFNTSYTIATSDNTALLGATANGNLSFAVSGTVYSGQSTWNNNGSGTWSGGNFIDSGTTGGTTGAAPGTFAGFSDTAAFGTQAASAITVSLADGQQPSLTNLAFNGTTNYTIDGSANGSGLILNNPVAGSSAITATGSGTYLVNAGVQLAQAAQIDVSGTGVLTIGGTSGVLSGSGALTKVGTGTLYLRGNNAGYANSITFTAGTVKIDDASNLGTGSLIFNGGVLQSTTGGYTLSNAITVNSATSGFRVDSGTVTLSGTITGNNTLASLGAGTIIFTGTNSSTADTVVSGGTAQFTAGSGGTGGSINNNDTTLAGGGTLAFNQAGVSGGQYSGNITGTGNVQVTGSGGLVLTGNATGNYSGTTAVTSSGLTVTNTGSLGQSGTLLTNSTLTFANTGAPRTLNYSGSLTSAGSSGSSSSLNLNGNTLNLTGGISKNGTVFTVSGGTLNVTGLGISGSNPNSDLVVNNGTLNVGAVSTFNGPTTISNSGTLRLTANSVTPTAPRTDVTFSGSGTNTLDINGTSGNAVATLNSTTLTTASVTLSSGSLTVGSTSGTATYAGSISGTGGVLAKDGNNTQVFTGNLTYTGATTISAGQFVVGTGGVLGAIADGAPQITVNAGSGSAGGLLGGTGTINRAVTVGGTSTLVGSAGQQTHVENAILSPGNTYAGASSVSNSVGTLTINSALTLNGTYQWDLASNSTAAGQYDQITGLTGLTLGSNSELRLNFLSGQPSSTSFWTSGTGVTRSWNLLSGSFASPTGQFSILTGTGGTSIFDATLGTNALRYASLGEFYVSYASNGVVLNWTPVPEPGSLLLGGLAALGMGAAGWRRRRAVSVKPDETPAVEPVVS